MKFFLNSTTTSYLRDLESEFGESSNAIRMELNRMEEAKLLYSYKNGNKKIFRANRKHPLFGDIPATLDEIMASELKYLEAYEKHPFRTDWHYFWKAFVNIVFRKARSN